MIRPHEVALSYVGQKELAGNKFSNDTEFGKKIHAMGQHDGDSWCCFFMELVCKEAYPEMAAILDKLFSANVNITYQNFKNSKVPEFKITTVPVVDSLIVWQQYKGGKPVNLGTPEKPIYPGHIGIVSYVNPNDTAAFESIEGNTSTPGVREGYIVARNPHRVHLDANDGLRTLGFIKVK